MGKRSSEAGIAGADIGLDGVGGRQGAPLSPGRGGGYLDECTAPEFLKKTAALEKKMRDPRLDELRRIGLQRPWIEVAEAIGVDAVLTLWRILDADPSSSCNGTTLRVPLRSWKTYLRYQRNRYIEDLRQRGLSYREIQRRVLVQLGEKLHVDHIRMILGRR